MFEYLAAPDDLWDDITPDANLMTFYKEAEITFIYGSFTELPEPTEKCVRLIRSTPRAGLVGGKNMWMLASHSPSALEKAIGPKPDRTPIFVMKLPDSNGQCQTLDQAN